MVKRCSLLISCGVLRRVQPRLHRGGPDPLRRCGCWPRPRRRHFVDPRRCFPYVFAARCLRFSASTNANSFTCCTCLDGTNRQSRHVVTLRDRPPRFVLELTKSLTSTERLRHPRHRPEPHRSRSAPALSAVPDVSAIVTKSARTLPLFSSPPSYHHLFLYSCMPHSVAPVTLPQTCVEMRSVVDCENTYTKIG